MFTAIAQLWSVIQGLGQLLRAFSLWLAKREVEKRDANVKNAAQALKHANEVEDDIERLKAKSEAACRLERLSDPKSDCAAPTDS